jgi:HEAT repeat protein
LGLAVVIKASNSDWISELIADLASDSMAARESASARLAVIGPRAVERLRSLIRDTGESSLARAEALRALGAISDSRGLRTAIGVTRLFVRGPKSVAIVERLTELALDRGRTAAVRLAALDALGDLDSETVRPLREALRDDPIEGIRQFARQSPASRHVSDLDLLRNAAEVELPSDPAPLLRALSRRGKEATVTELHHLLERTREQEPMQTPSSEEWSRVRAATHTMLAQKGSLLGLYDIREWLECATAPLPVELLPALRAIGDATCLNAIAVAHARIDDHWWREHLVDVFSVIVERSGLTRRHGAIRKLERRWPAVFPLLWRERRDVPREGASS